MYIKRNDKHREGVFQATSFINKSVNSPGLRAGGYFISMAVCLDIMKYYSRKEYRKQRQEPTKSLQSLSNRPKGKRESYIPEITKEKIIMREQDISAICGTSCYPQGEQVITYSSSNMEPIWWNGAHYQCELTYPVSQPQYVVQLIPHQSYALFDVNSGQYFHHF
jgi:hypothetical protein